MNVVNTELKDLRKKQFELLRLILDLTKEDKEYKMVSLSKIVKRDPDKRGYEQIQSSIGRLMKAGWLTRPFWGTYCLTEEGREKVEEMISKISSPLRD